MRVTDLLAPERVKVPLASGDKEGVLRELVELVVRSLAVEAQREAIAQAVREREEVLSTGIGEGIALPHAKFNGLSGMVMAAGVSRVPVEYNSLDGQPVRLFFLLLGPEETAGGQVRALSRIGRLMRDGELRKRLESSADAPAFLHELEQAEGVL